MKSRIFWCVGLVRSPTLPRPLARERVLSDFLANGKTMNIVDETGYKRMPSPLERMIFAGNKYQSTDALNKYVFLPGVVGGICYAFYSFISGFGNQKLTALQQAKKMNGRVNGKFMGSRPVFGSGMCDYICIFRSTICRHTNGQCRCTIDISVQA